MNGTPLPQNPPREIGSEVIDTEMSGFLFKRRGGYGKLTFNPWQLRYFTIKDGYLSYYESQENTELSEARGTFDLREEFEMQGGPCSIEGSPNNFTIQISIPNEEKWKLCAENKDEYSKWKAAISSFCELKGAAARTPRKVNENGYGSPNVPSIVQRLSIMGSGSLSAQATPRTINSSSNNNSDSEKDISPKVSSNNLAPVPTIDSQPKASTPIVTNAHDISTNANSAVGAPSAKPKKGLKAKASSGMFDSDQIELLMVIVIVNVSLIMFNLSSSTVMSGLYAIIINFVVIQTLLLRAKRSTTAAIPVLNEVSPTSSGGSMTVVNSNSTVTTVSSSSPLSPLGDAGVEISHSDVSSTVTGGKPKAGGTYPFVEGVSPNVPPHTWSKCDYKRFKVRDIDYEVKKKKCPSEEPLYNVFAVDVFCTDNRMDNVTQHMELPDCSELQINNPHVPPIFCVQVQMPSDPPASSISPFIVEDGPGWAIVVYFKMTQKTCDQLNGVEKAFSAVKLFAKWCENYQDPAWKARFKVIASCLNMEELGVPSMISSWNAKPVLIRKTSTLYKTPKYLETTIHVFKFANMAKASIHMLTSRCSQMFMEIGFTIEGRGNPELPECLIGCAAINKPSEDKVGYLFND